MSSIAGFTRLGLDNLNIRDHLNVNGSADFKQTTNFTGSANFSTITPVGFQNNVEMNQNLTIGGNLLIGGCITQLGNCGVVFLKQSDFTPEYVVSTSGRYYLAENIVWEPTQDGVSCDDPIAGITVAANNVEINLNGYTFSQKTDISGEPIKINTVGIKINPGVEHVIIHNGTIEKIGALGIYAKASVGNDISTILIENMTIRYCGRNSFVSNGLQYGIPCGSTVFFANTCGCIGFFGLVQGFTQLAFVRKFIVRNCRLLDYGRMVGSDSIGVSAVSVIDGIVENCIIKGTESNNVVSSGVDGFGIIFVEDFYVFNCEISNILGNGLYSTAIKYIFVNRFEIYDTVITNVHLIGTLNVADLLGTVTEVNSTGIKFLSCTNGDVRNCMVTNVTSDLQVSPGFGSSAQGSLITDSDNIRMDNCNFSGINFAGNTGFAAGIQTSSTNSSYKNIKVTNVSSDVTGDAWGFRVQPFNQGGFFFPTLVPVFGNIFESCIAENMGDATLSLVNQGGFVVRSVSTFSNENNILKDSISRGNVGHGVLVDGSLAKINIIQNNKVSKNTLDGINDSTGLVIDKNVYISNEAYKNTTNYVSLPAGTPISIWNLTGGVPPVTQGEFDNLNIL